MSIVEQGRVLSHYRLLDKVGEGGMGNVWRAEDTRLGRSVAIKLLPEAFAHDPSRLQRLEREARILGALNHPNIGAIYGLEESDGIRFLVLEFVPGVTLAERVQRGPLDVGEALATGLQVAEAVAAAHEKDVIHRDLKPGNIMLTPEGRVKVLDFGIAKGLEHEPAAADPGRSPTIQETRPGMILGTAAYMSPEQTRGLPLDRRSDLWSLGCVLFESLTGRRAFAGDTTSDTIARILDQEPDWRGLPGQTPEAACRLLRRCLEKDLRRRLHDAGDARIELDEALAELSRPRGGASAEAEGPRPRRGKRALVRAGVGAALVTSAFVAGVFLRIGRGSESGHANTGPVIRVAVAEPPAAVLAGDHAMPAIAVSPDGRTLVYAGAADGRRRLFLRAADRLEAVPIPGSEDAQGPFFSPDGQWLGFFARGTLWKVSLRGGPPLHVCKAPLPRGACWGENGAIALAPIPEAGLERVSAAGGTPEVLTVPDRSHGERSHRWPCFLPGAKAILYSVGTSGITTFDEGRIDALSLETGERRSLIEGGMQPLFLPSGWLLYMKGGSLVGVRFDPERLAVSSPPMTLLEGVAYYPHLGCAHVAVSPAGTLAYLPGPRMEREGTLFWVGPGGKAAPIVDMQEPFVTVSVSPDGRSLALQVDAANSHVWTYDLARGVMTRITFAWSNYRPIWTPDGRILTFASDQFGLGNLCWRASDGSGEVVRLATSAHKQWPTSWSPDGSVLAYVEQHPDSGTDIWLLPATGSREPQVFLRTPFNEGDAQFSPDGRWLAYTSDESGRNEIYLRPYPGSGSKWQISSGGGVDPRWSRSGRDLYFRGREALMAVAISTKPDLEVSNPRFVSAQVRSAYDVARDGTGRVAAIVTEEVDASGAVCAVFNWEAEVARLAEAARASPRR